MMSLDYINSDEFLVEIIREINRAILRVEDHGSGSLKVTIAGVEYNLDYIGEEDA